MSLLPMGGLKPSPNPWLADNYPAALLTMGLTAERVARHYGVSREDQDAFALASHQKALAAQAAGRFAEELIPVKVTSSVPGAKAGKPVVSETVFAADEGPRADTSADALATLKPVFHAQGTVTAGNSSQTSDGAAAVVLMEAGRAKELGVRPLARLVAYAAMGCLPEEMGIGPIFAVPKALQEGGAHAERYGRHRIERGVRRAGAGRDSRTGDGSGEGECEWRRDCARASAGLHGSKADSDAAWRDATAEGALRDGDDVRGRRDGRGGDF